MLKSKINPKFSGKNLTPNFILEKCENGNFNGEFHACSIFVDISGFTKTTETLTTHGKEGAEVLDPMKSHNRNLIF